jgi:hypothetical protein
MRTIIILSCAIWGGPIVLATLAALPAMVSSRYRRLVGAYLVGGSGNALAVDGLSGRETEGN